MLISLDSESLGSVGRLLLLWAVGVFCFGLALLFLHCFRCRRAYYRRGAFAFIRDINKVGAYDVFFQEIREIGVWRYFGRPEECLWVYIALWSVSFGIMVRVFGWLAPIFYPVRVTRSVLLSFSVCTLASSYFSTSFEVAPHIYSWSSAVVSMLRLSSFVSGEDVPEERGHVVYENILAYFDGVVPDMNRPMTQDEAKKEFGKGSVRAVFVPDGTYIRVPNSEMPLSTEALKKLYIPVTKDDIPLSKVPEGGEDEEEEEDPTYDVVYVPPNFHFRCATYFILVFVVYLFLYSHTFLIITSLLGKPLLMCQELMLFQSDSPPGLLQIDIGAHFYGCTVILCLFECERLLSNIQDKVPRLPMMTQAGIISAVRGFMALIPILSYFLLAECLHSLVESAWKDWFISGFVEAPLVQCFGMGWAGFAESTKGWVIKNCVYQMRQPGEHRYTFLKRSVQDLGLKEGLRRYMEVYWKRWFLPNFFWMAYLMVVQHSVVCLLKFTFEHEGGGPLSLDYALDIEVEFKNPVVEFCYKWSYPVVCLSSYVCVWLVEIWQDVGLQVRTEVYGAVKKLENADDFKVEDEN